MAVSAVHVAVGVIIDAQGRILISRRANHVHQGGLWEFPGGKVESGETVEQALHRELNEELAIMTLAVRPLLIIDHDYGDKKVCLDVWWVDQFKGHALGREGQLIEWVAVSRLNQYQFPAANQVIIQAIQQSNQARLPD